MYILRQSTNGNQAIIQYYRSQDQEPTVYYSVLELYMQVKYNVCSTVSNRGEPHLKEICVRKLLKRTASKQCFPPKYIKHDRMAWFGQGLQPHQSLWTCLIPTSKDIVLCIFGPTHLMYIIYWGEHWAEVLYTCTIILPSKRQ